MRDIITNYIRAGNTGLYLLSRGFKSLSPAKRTCCSLSLTVSQTRGPVPVRTLHKRSHKFDPSSNS